VAPGKQFHSIAVEMRLTRDARCTKLTAHQERVTVMKRLGTGLIALACVFTVASAHAFDPLSLIVLRMIRDHVASAQLEAALTPRDAERRLPAAPMAQYPRDLKMLVDEGFPQLDAAQREAVRQRLHDIMNDPQYAAQRDEILREFVEATSAARRTREALSHLSEAQKRSIAAQAAAAYRDKDPEALQNAIETLRSDAVPIPTDLRELMLAEFHAESERAR
jgi:hypothetical protein